MATINVTYVKNDVSDEFLMQALGKALNYPAKIKSVVNNERVIIDNPVSLQAFINDNVCQFIDRLFVQGGQALAAEKASQEFREKYK